MLLGDLNASPAQFQKLGTIPGLVPLIQGIPTNSRQNKTLDNILTDLQMSREYTGRSGAIDVERMFRLQLADAERISDHLPIWAEFTISEQVGGFSSMAGATPTVVR
jgi:endonuclease/exonuclease/phosphatase family metal-dependent hydrolase